MKTGIELVIMLLIAIFIILYRKNPGENLYNNIVSSFMEIYDKYAPYSYKKKKKIISCDLCFWGLVKHSFSTPGLKSFQLLFFFFLPVVS